MSQLWNGKKYQNSLVIFERFFSPLFYCSYEKLFTNDLRWERSRFYYTSLTIKWLLNLNGVKRKGSGCVFQKLINYKTDVLHFLSIFCLTICFLLFSILGILKKEENVFDERIKGGKKEQWPICGLSVSPRPHFEFCYPSLWH